jgi:hypothetical protein
MSCHASDRLPVARIIGTGCGSVNEEH